VEHAQTAILSVNWDQKVEDMEVLAVPFVDLKAQYVNIKTEIDEAVMRVLGNCNFVLGEEVEKFEASFAAFLGCRHAIAVSNGLDALRLSLGVLGIGAGDEVIIPANTFIATALAVSSVNARPVLVDIDPKSYNLDPNLIEEAITPSTRAIMPVHLFGQSADMVAIIDIAHRHSLFVIEDACQSHGARYRGKRTGTFGDLGCFSFYPSKNLGAYGDGGAVVTNRQDLAEKVARLRNYGQQAKYHHSEKGWNARLDTLQAAVLNIKLKYLDEWNHSRLQHAIYYSEQLKKIDELQIPQIQSDRDHIFHLYVIRTRFRDQLQEFLKRRKITTLIHYPVPIHLQQAYTQLGYKMGDFPNTEQAAAEILSLPMYVELQTSQLNYVTQAISDFYQEL
jgi:dTDP-3-amino-3,4,6-trideoxy-alpha-D-glucose transaminase